MVRVRCAEQVLRSLAGVRRFISIDSPRNSESVVRALVDAADSLAAFPLRGRVVPEYGQEEVRELLLCPYRIIYLVSVDEVVVLSVMHGHQLLPGDLVRED